MLGETLDKEQVYIQETRKVGGVASVCKNRCPVPLIYMVTANRAVGFEIFSHGSWDACVKAFYFVRTIKHFCRGAPGLSS